ncbi:MAG: thiamine-phosphate kinase [Pseudomonadota bacterium]|nr:thiamine-phosphate kinase [Pseudomonadota bacterium]
MSTDRPKKISAVSTEFDVINQFFRDRRPHREDVIVGIGDDAAVVKVPSGYQLVLTMDTLVEGVHFTQGMAAREIGHKALAVNLSDLAAMAADPAWVLLSLTLPELDPQWLDGFTDGFLSLADTFGVELIGGDMSRGGMSLSVTAGGFVPSGGAIRRSGARPGDCIFVTGTLGDAALALQLLDDRTRGAPNHRTQLLSRLYSPMPRVRQALTLRQYASAAIDISDGLLGDLGHVCRESGVGAAIWVELLPRSEAFEALADGNEAYELALGGGDDYELCLTVPPEHYRTVENLGAELGCDITQIGVIERDPVVRCLYNDGREYQPRTRGGYRHFGLDRRGR